MRTHLTKALLALALLAASTTSRGDEPKAEKGPANRLARETSPYLLMHAHNPVDWYPWGPEAFARAKAENKPIFLSIGYSSCYWCHVMERQSFVNPEIAKAINAGFIAIKVDREERPDVDQVYMTAVQAFTGGGGGWPMSVFMTSDGRPFFGGTYFKPEEFGELLKAVADAWRDQRPAIEHDADALSDAVRKASSGSNRGVRTPLSRTMAAGGRLALFEQFDPEFGGFGFNPERPRRPKFPEPANLLYLLDQNRRDEVARTKPTTPDPLMMVDKTLDAMTRGGIRDHLAGGYHRYSTVRDWSVPHFEKMLYDNAQLAEAYTLAFERTGNPRWRIEAEATFAFVARTLTSTDGLFFSSLDAESDAEEGKSYVWTRAEIEQAVGSPEDFALFARTYGLSAPPNFEGGRHVLLEPRAIDPATDAKLAPIRARVLAVRDRRPAPKLDDKVLTSWNALMITAYAEGYRVFHDDRYKLAAERAADALLATMKSPDGRLLRTSRAGQAKLGAYLEDYAFLTYALVRLHAATGNPVRLTQAKALADRMIKDFADTKDGGFFYTSGDHETLLARTKDPFDNAVPGANSVAIRALVALGVAAREPRYLDEAGRALDAFSHSLATRPSGSPLMLLGLEEYLDARPEAARSDVVVEPPLPGAPGVVKAEGRQSQGDAVAPGSEVDVEVDLTIKAGYHIYANPSNNDNVIPTVVTLAPGSTTKLVEVRYPTGELKVLAANGGDKVAVYEQKVTIKVRLRLADDSKAGESKVSVRLRYQACDDRACLAPATIDVPVRVEIKPR